MAGKRVQRENRRARFDVAVEETLEAGLVLTGDEIKSIRQDRVQLTGAFVRLVADRGELPRPVVVGLHLSAAKEPERTKALLLHEKEVLHLQELVSAKGKTAVPLKVYLRRGWAKLEIGIGSGRKRHDKRRLLRDRAIERDQQQTLKQG